MKNKNAKSGDDKFITIDMPEVKDIPGQEHIKPPRIQEMMDSTPSSDDEEGKGLLDDLNKEDETDENDDSSNVSELERDLLDKSDGGSDEDIEFDKLKLDDTDDDGEQLNEKANLKDGGKDLDVPGANLDDDDEAIGEEDEENNSYSMPD